MAKKKNRRIWMIEKPFWMFRRVTRQIWRWAKNIWQGVMKFLNRDITSLVIICLYAVAAAIIISFWPTSRSWLGLYRKIDIVLLAIFFLWALMLLVWVHEKVQEQMLRWVPALLAMPVWLPLFIPLFAGLLLFTLLLFGVSVLLTPVGALAMAVGLVFAWWRQRHGITLRCKFGECFSGHRSFRDVEVQYACPGKCGTNYGYLIPSHHGFLFHHCTCGGKILALRSLRQKKIKDGKALEDSLDKYCPHGRHPWASATDPLPAHFIAVAGGTSSGKTCYITMVLKDLLNSSGDSGPPYKGHLEDKRDLQTYSENMEKLNRGVRLKETQAGEPPVAFIVRLQNQGGKQARLYLYDAAGERYTSLQEEAVDNFVFFEDLTGIVLMVDPLGLTRVTQQVKARDPDLWKELKVSELPFEYVVAGLCKNISRWVQLSGGRTEVPLAIVVNKVDAPIVKDVLGNEAKKAAAGKGVPENDICRQALLDWGAAKEVQVLESNFRHLRYFSCSSLGRTPDQSHRPFVAEQVLPPLLWLLSARYEEKGNA